MSVEKFCILLNEAKLGKNDKVWFPRWIRRYATTIKTPRASLSVGEREVILFLQTLRDHGTPAWQRLQAVRAVPVVFSRGEVAMLLPEFVALKRPMFLTIYGAGSRLMEACRLQVKDIVDCCD